MVRDGAEFHVHVGELVERLGWGLRHFGLHREKTLFRRAQRVGFLLKKTLEPKPVFGELRGVEVFRELGFRKGQKLRREETFFLSRAACCVDVLPQKGLELAVSRILRGTQGGVGPEFVADPLHFEGEIEAFLHRVSPLPERAAKRGVLGDPGRPVGKIFLPIRGRGVNGFHVPPIPGGNLLAGRYSLNVGHR